MIVEEVLFSKKECDKIIEIHKVNSQKWKSNDREYKSFSIILNEETEWIFSKMKTFFEKESGLKIQTMKNEVHFHVFETNDWFGVHNDTRDNRLFSLGVLLNDDFDGGEFNLYHQGKEIILEKKVGNTYIFDVAISHEVKPLLKGNRYSLIWFIQNNHVKVKSNKFL
jgi:predicted 2-oxoglutarate/Fe(II)-dependent dioxygenase YbiX